MLNSHHWGASIFKIHTPFSNFLPYCISSNSGLTKEKFSVDKTESAVAMPSVSFCDPGGKMKMSWFVFGWMAKGFWVVGVGVVWCLIIIGSLLRQWGTHSRHTCSCEGIDFSRILNGGEITVSVENTPNFKGGQVLSFAQGQLVCDGCLAQFLSRQ